MREFKLKYDKCFVDLYNATPSKKEFMSRAHESRFTQYGYNIHDFIKDVMKIHQDDIAEILFEFMAYPDTKAHLGDRIQWLLERELEIWWGECECESYVEDRRDEIEAFDDKVMYEKDKVLKQKYSPSPAFIGMLEVA